MIFTSMGDFRGEKFGFLGEIRDCEEKKGDFRVNGGFAKRKILMFGLNQGFAKRKRVIFA